MPPIERWPIGGYLSRFTTSFASAALSTCGMTMTSAPLSNARVAIEYSPFGTRAIGAMPASSAAVEICAQASSDITPCSMSRNSQSKPATAMALAISTLRVMRTPTPGDSADGGWHRWFPLGIECRVRRRDYIGLSGATTFRRLAENTKSPPAAAHLSALTPSPISTYRQPQKGLERDLRSAEMLISGGISLFLRTREIPFFFD